MGSMGARVRETSYPTVVETNNTSFLGGVVVRVSHVLVGFRNRSGNKHSFNYNKLTRINVSSLGTKIDLHINDNNRSVGRSQVAIVGPLVRISIDKLWHDDNDKRNNLALLCSLYLSWESKSSRVLGGKFQREWGTATRTSMVPYQYGAKYCGGTINMPLDLSLFPRRTFFFHRFFPILGQKFFLGERYFVGSEIRVRDVGELLVST